jgi:hypothetical protein
MTEELRRPIHLSVHETADPGIINPSSDQHITNSEDTSDLNDSVHDEENVDIPIPKISAETRESDLVDRQIDIVNRSAG